MHVHRVPIVNQAFISDILVEVLSLSSPCGPQVYCERLLDATALLCGLTPPLPVVRILYSCVHCILSQVTVQ